MTYEYHYKRHAKSSENQPVSTTREKSSPKIKDDSKIQTNDNLNLNSVETPEIPDGIIFPDQLNRYFREKIRTLTSENGGLRRSLLETQEELTSVTDKLSKLQQANVQHQGKASESAANKIVELSKKLREQTAELESLRNRVKEAEARSKSLEQAAAPPSPIPPVSQNELAEKEMQLKVLTERLQTNSNKLYEARNQLQTVKQELKIAHKVIANEVGEKYALQDLAKENGNWRGRAQQIISLQNKIQQMQEQMNQSSNSAVSDTPATNVLRQIEKERRASYEEATKHLQQKSVQLEDVKRKLDAARARNKVLENDIIQVKSKMASLLDKSVRDDQLIAALSSQISAFEDRYKEQGQSIGKLQGEIGKLKEENSLEKLRAEQIQKALLERDNTIRRLEEHTEELKRQRQQNIKSESEPIKPTEKLTDNQTGQEQNVKLMSMVDAERARLLELLAVTNRRLDDARREQMETESNLRREKSKIARLETKIARLELERVGSVRTNRGSYSQTTNRGVDGSSTSVSNVSAKQQIEYLEEECLALKARIQTLQMEKEHDIKVFAAIRDLKERGTVVTSQSATLLPLSRNKTHGSNKHDVDEKEIINFHLVKKPKTFINNNNKLPSTSAEQKQK